MKLSASRLVDEYIEALPQPQQAIADKVRATLLECIPHLDERFSFKVPFYHYYGMFAYLRAADGVVYLCFCRGKDLLEAFPQLEQKDRAIMCCVKLTQLKDLQTMEVPALIASAAEWNKEAARFKIPLLKKKDAKK